MNLSTKSSKTANSEASDISQNQLEITFSEQHGTQLRNVYKVNGQIAYRSPELLTPNSAERIESRRATDTGLPAKSNSTHYPNE